MIYADVAIDAGSDSVDHLFTYEAPEGVAPGSRVTAPFGLGGKPRAGYVFALRSEPPEGLGSASIRRAEEGDGALSITADDIEICSWMARRYFCRLYEAVTCFLPVGKPSAKGNKRVPKWEEPPAEVALPEMTEEQAEAFSAIAPAIRAGKFAPFLVQGVTGSGKTEIYMRAVSEALSLGRRAIVLVPEISLTHQTIRRFISRFGADRIAVLHSRLTYGERYDEWARIKEGAADIVIGARSAVFAPVPQLGVIVVDEEHETTYKSDHSPKYDAVEVAMRRARLAGAAVVLGSATPSAVSRHRADRGLYHLVRLTKRYNETPLPRVRIEDMRTMAGGAGGGLFSDALKRGVEESLSRGRQVMLFLNRRGYSPAISCPDCGYTLSCGDCGISLTYHKQQGLAICHFCGAASELPDACPVCGGRRLRMLGAGTEKVEEAARAEFPGASVARLDLDTSAKKGNAASILRDFEKGRTDILIGTQMIAKGLDFANVGLVGVVAADVGLNIPDFRSAERTFQIITQVAGRSGRGEETGEVIVQTRMPGHYAIVAAAGHDYESFYKEEIALRQSLGYPPFSDILRIAVASVDEKTAARGADDVKEWLLEGLAGIDRANILGPGKAPVEKIGDDYRYYIHIKAPTAGREAYQDALAAYKKKINADKRLGWRIIIDVNPFSLL